MNLIETNFNNKRLGYPWVTLFLTLIFFGVILHIYLPNLGGSGLSLPLNIISNFSIALFIFLVSIIQLKRTTLFYSTASNLISIGLIIFIFICFFFTRCLSTKCLFNSILDIRDIGFLSIINANQFLRS